VGLPTDQMQIIMSDCLLFVEQIFSFIMVRSSFIRLDDNGAHFVLNQHT